MKKHFAAIVLCLALATTAAAKPNVLLICVDDLKPLLGCYGATSVRSPCIDRLAARGVLFERAFCNQAVCAPSRNALMTGLRPQTIGIYDLGTNFRKAVPDAAYADGMIADEAIRRLQAAKAKPGEPWFIAVGFLKPHLPFCAPKKYWDLYDPAAFPLPALKKPPIGAPAFAPTTWGELRQYSDIPATGPLDDATTRHLIHGYHAAVSYMDAQLGRVLDELDRLGLAKSTVVVLWGDHGWHLGDHGMWCKHTNYEQAARIPLIVSGPGVAKPGVNCGALAETVDIYPTLCELAGLPVPPGLDGASFAAALVDPSAATKEAVFHAYPRSQVMGRAVRTARHRLVEWKKPGAAADTAILELYDYEADPAETKNLAAERPEIVAKLRAMLAQQPEAKPQVGTGKKAGSKPAAATSRQDRAAMFAKRDANGDAKLSREEFLAKQPDPDEAPKRFAAFDIDKDGFLSKDEFVTTGGKARP